MQGTNHQTVVKGRAPRHRGVCMGRVLRVFADKGMILLRPDDANFVWPLKPGDGVVFDAAAWRSPQEPEEGGRLYQVYTLRSGEVELRFGNGDIKFERIRGGDLLWRTNDPDLHKAAQLYTRGQTAVQKQGLRMRVRLYENEPLTLECNLLKFPIIKATAVSPDPLHPAQKQAFSEALLREQLGRLGNTPYELAALEIDVSGNPFVPSSLLNQMRREVIDQITQLQAQPPEWVIRDAEEVLRRNKTEAVFKTEAVSKNVNLHILVRTPEQLDAALAMKIKLDSITLDYLDLYGLRPAVERVQAAGITARVASPRILKPNEQRVVNFLTKLNCEILVRSTGLLQALREVESERAWIGDFSLNAANVLSAQTFLDLGLARITPTYDLNAAQIVQLTKAVDPGKIEVVAYMHLPVFHTEHCVFCRFLSNGTSYKDCGHPCEKHQVALRDVNGRAHPVMADVGCRNTVFGAEAQEISAHLDHLRGVGIRHYRLEFVHETAEQVSEVIDAFQRALSDKQSSADLGRQLRQLSPQGTTEGSFFVPQN